MNFHSKHWAGMKKKSLLYKFVMVDKNDYDNMEHWKLWLDPWQPAAYPTVKFNLYFLGKAITLYLVGYKRCYKLLKPSYFDVLLTPKSIMDLEWIIFSHGAHSPNFAPLDYHLFQLMHHQKFKNVFDIQNFIDNMTALKSVILSW